MITPFSQTFFNRSDYPRIEQMWYYHQLGESYKSRKAIRCKSHDGFQSS